MLGYSPERKDETEIPFYYWPYFMNGRIFLSSVFDSMISSTINQFNHLETFKKLVSNSYYKKYCDNKSAKRKYKKMQ